MWQSNSFILILLIISGLKSYSQKEVVTAPQAVAWALEKNYDIKLAVSDSIIATNNNTIGNAGMLPKITLNASQNTAFNNLHQKYSSGTEVNRSGVRQNTISSSVALTWTLFDGMKMFATQQKLRLLEQQGAVLLKDRIQTTVSITLIAYYDIVLQQQKIKAQIQNNKISEERVKVCKLKFENGTSGKSDYLQAQVDLNAGKSTLTQLNAGLKQKKHTLCQTAGTSLTDQFEVEDTIPVRTDILLSDIEQQTLQNNYQLQNAQSNIKIAEESKKEISAQRFPTINLNSGYNFSYNKTGAGQVLFNQGFGPYIGFSASVPIFNANNTERLIQNSKIEINRKQYELDKIKLQINNLIQKNYEDYTFNIEVLKLEEENIKLAQENVNIALSRLQLSQGTALEVVIAQNSLTAAYNRLFTARYNAKLSETELLRLSSKLLK